MTNHLRFRHGKTEGEADSPLGMVLLTVIAIVYRCAPYAVAAVGYFSFG